MATPSASRQSRFDLRRASKLPPGSEYYDVNYLWVPGLRRVVHGFYRAGIRPEAVLAMSLVAGSLAAWCFAHAGYGSLLWGALLIQAKNYLDTVDGHLARAMGVDSRFGRFLDSLSDFLVYLFVFTAIGVRLRTTAGGPGLLLSYAAMVSAFIQCSYYNYYLVEYLRITGSRTHSRTDERAGEFDGGEGLVLSWLRRAYLLVYGWQDRLIGMVDRWMRSLSGGQDDRAVGAGGAPATWYTDKRFLAANSPLCFGTQILALSVASVAGRLDVFLYFLLLPANLYLVFLMLARLWQARQAAAAAN